MKAMRNVSSALATVAVLLSASQISEAQTISPLPSSQVSNNTGATIANNSAARDINISVHQGWELNHQPVVKPNQPGLSSSLQHDFDSTTDVDLLVGQLKRDKQFSAFLILLTGATGNVQVSEAIKRLETSANDGSGLSAMLLSISLENGWWGKSNPQEARRYRGLAADSGEAGAQSYLIESYLNGINGYTKDIVKSTAYLEKLVNNENAQKQTRAQNALFLGNRLINGSGIAKNVCRGVQMIAMSAAMGNAVAMLAMGFERESKTRCLPVDTAKALDWYEKGADAGDSFSAYEAGRMLQFGIGGPRNFVAAERHYLAASSASADRQLAWIYGKGLATVDRQANYSKALAFARRAADAGDGPAMIIVALLFEYGLGVEQNGLEAFRWYGKAATTNELRGRVNQAALVMNGCVSQEYMPTWLAELTEIAKNDNADKGDRSSAAYYLGMAYSRGLAGVVVNEQLAARLIEQACNTGNDNACVEAAANRPASEISPTVAAGALRANQSGLKTEGAACHRTVISRSVDSDTFP